MTYRAPLDDIRLALGAAGELDALIASGHAEGVDQALATSILEESARFAEDEIAPLNAPGDSQGTHLVNGVVVMPTGWKEAYQRWTAAGWNALPCPPDFGGQGLPHTLATAVLEIWNAANLSFGLGPLLTQGAIDAIAHSASDDLKQRFLPKMVEGRWTGTMNLTEPHAGTDLGLLKTRAEPHADGSYRLKGTKIFITYGDHELTENIIHLVLARLPDAPAGTRGISLFLVPKFLLDADGNPGKRNDVRCVGLEEKLGIHASPTCVMNYGDGEGAVGYLVGEANRGLNGMFIMMNRARLAVGMQGVAIAERATQRAIAYANDRKQGRSSKSADAGPGLIVNHPDVRRNILTMKALTMASRALCLATAHALDVSERSTDPAEKSTAAARCALLTPVAKAFSTDAGTDVASIGVQIHGGMGFIEGTGAAQHYRDARILQIYEGTNGIQAIDLVTRKLPMENGAVVAAYIGELAATVTELKGKPIHGLGGAADRLGEAVGALAEASKVIGRKLADDPDTALAVSTPYLRLFGLAAGGVYLARQAARATAMGDNHASVAITICRYFAENLAIEAPALLRLVVGGGAAVLEADEAVFRV